MKKRREFAWLFRSVMGILVVLIVLTVLLLWGAYRGRTKVNNTSSKLLEEIGNAASSGGEIVITEDDVNYLSELFLPRGIKRNNIEIKGIYTEIVNKAIIFKIPIRYRGINVLLTSKDKINYRSYKGVNRLIIKPIYFKIGLIPLPSNFVLGILKNSLKDNIIIDNKSIIINKNLLAFDIKTILIDNGKLKVGIVKSRIIEMTKKNINEGNKNHSESVKNGNRLPKVTESKGSTTERSGILSRASKQLTKAANNVSTLRLKGIINSAKLTIDKMKINRYYNYQEDLLRLSAKYDMLSESEKAKVKAAILKYVDTKALLKIYAKNNE